MTDSREFYVIEFENTDGCDTGPGYWPFAEAKPATTVKKSPRDVVAPEKATRTKPQMLRLDENDARFVEWRIKLGILLKQELSPAADGPPWYVQFPEGYWLYERSKHLWVSGYRNKAKLFRSPQEFGVHLIWLLSASEDEDDCRCIHCNAAALTVRSEPDVLEIVQSVDATKRVKSDSRNESRSTAPSRPMSNPGTPALQPAASSSGVSVRAAVQPTSQALPPATQPPPGTHEPAAKLAPKPAPRPAPGQALNPAAFSPSPNPSTAVERTAPASVTPLWSEPTSLLFRLGELVWYQNSSIWRLGIVAAPHQPSGSYQLVPLGHALMAQTPMFKTDNEMRPFHAFSVPPVVAAELKQLMFDNVLWASLFHSATPDTSRRDLLLLDGSKMAAVKIDFSYSLFNPLDDGRQPVSLFGGVFLGAERIELGDSLRIRGVGEEMLALGLRKISVSAATPHEVLFSGPEYRLVPGGNLSSSASAQGGGSSGGVRVPFDQLPAALREEAMFRAGLARQRPEQQHQQQPQQPSLPPPVWVRISTDAVHSESTVRGRFYPTNRLMPILNPQLFQATVAQGFVDDSITYLNNRMDAPGRYLGRKANRIETLGASVPHGTIISYEQTVVEQGARATIQID